VNITLGSTPSNVVHEYVVPPIGSGGQVPHDFILNSPGWQWMPLPMPATIGASNTQVLWRNGPAAMRKAMLESWGGASDPGWTERSGTGDFGTNWAHFYSQFYNRGVVSLDAMLIYLITNTGDFPATWSSESNGQCPVAPVPIISGGGSVDLSPVTTALNDIATRSVDYVANNGGAIFSMYGKVNTTP
jgi:hypothetical protein